MVILQKLLEKILVEISKLEPEQYSPASDSTNVSLSTYNSCYVIGRICILNLNLQTTGSISSGGNMVKNLPNPIGRVTACITTGQPSGKVANVRITTAGILQADGAISTNAWYSGTIVYVTAS